MAIDRRSLLRSLSLAAAGGLVRPSTRAQNRTPGLPNVGLKADSGPLRSECGVGALMPWADALWAVTYNSHTRATGTGQGLYRIDDNLVPTLVHRSDGTHANPGASPPVGVGLGATPT